MKMNSSASPRRKSILRSLSLVMLAAPIGIRFQSGATTIRTRDKDRSVAAPTRPAAASSCGDNAHRQRKAPQAAPRQSRDDLQTTWKNRLEMGPAMNAQ